MHVYRGISDFKKVYKCMPLLYKLFSIKFSVYKILHVLNVNSFVYKSIFSKRDGIFEDIGSYVIYIHFKSVQTFIYFTYRSLPNSEIS